MVCFAVEWACFNKIDLVKYNIIICFHNSRVISVGGKYIVYPIRVELGAEYEAKNGKTNFGLFSGMCDDCGYGTRRSACYGN